MFLINDVLGVEDLQHTQQTLKGPHWGFGFTSTETNYPIWNFEKSHGKSIVDLLMKHEVFKDYALHDYHINAQTVNLDASLHRDSAYGVTHAFVFFPDEWNQQWGGRLHIYNPNGEIHTITPKKNTGVLFDADWPHYAEGTTIRARSRLRTSVGLKLVAI